AASPYPHVPAIARARLRARAPDPARTPGDDRDLAGLVAHGADGPVQRIRFAPQASPAPNDVSRTRALSRTRPARHARSRATGIEAADVLPTDSTSTTA